MKHILVISPDNPFLKHTGGQVCDCSIITKLSEAFVVHVATVSDTQIYELYNNVVIHRLSRRYDKVNTVKGKIEFFIQLFLNFLPRAASIISHRDNFTMLESVVNGNDINMVIFNHLDSVALRNLQVKTKILIHHNHESKLAKSLASNESTFLKRIFYLIESFKLRFLEASLRDENLSHFALSADEALSISDFLNKPCDLFPVQICDRLYQYSKEEDYIYIFGNWDYLPSREGLECVLDFFRNTDLPLKLKISGFCSSQVFIESLHKIKGVEYLGFIDSASVRHLLNSALITIIPIFIGAGVKIKIVEALECNACILTTKKALEGLPNPDLLIESVGLFDGLYDLPYKIQLLTSSKEMRLSLRSKACKYISQYRKMSDDVYEKFNGFV